MFRKVTTLIKKNIFESRKKKILFCLLFFLLVAYVAYQVFSYRPKPDKIIYGASFNVPYAIELGLDWQESYLAILDDLGVKNLRLAAHWPLVEPERNNYDFSYLDFQLEEALKRNIDVILVLGRRVPRWPECHVPEWATVLQEKEWQAEILDLMELIINRYKDFENISYWQVENEPYLEVFAYEHCGDLDEGFLDSQISLVRGLDLDRPILMTDSGNLGWWSRPYQKGDAFGTSVYLYFWNPNLGQFRTILPASFYRFKTNWNELRHGKQETFLIELSLEPWLIEPLIETPIEVQFEMMDLNRMNRIIDYAERTRFEKQYLWGAEWWYWLKEEHGMSDKWNFGKELFSS